MQQSYTLQKYYMYYYSHDKCLKKYNKQNSKYALVKIMKKNHIIRI